MLTKSTKESWSWSSSYGSWIFNYVISLSVICGKSVVFSGYSGFLHRKTDPHYITDILLKVALNTLALTNKLIIIYFNHIQNAA